MGDNRDDSLDSRFPADEGGIGMVPVENLIGRAFGDLLVDRRQRLLVQAMDLVHARCAADRLGNGYTGVAE